MFATFTPETQVSFCSLSKFPLTRADYFGAPSQALICDTNVLKRPANPTEIAQAMLWFISDASSFVSGSTLAVHAGQTPT